MQDFLETLLELLRDGDETIVGHAIKDLSDYRDPRIEAALFALLDNASEPLVDQALEALRRYDDWSGIKGGRALLLRLFDVSRPVASRRAIRLLGDCLDVSDRQFLCAGLEKAGDPQLITALLDTVDTRYDDDAIVAAVIAHLESIEALVRAGAVDALSRLDAAIPPKQLDALLDDPSSFVRARVISAQWGRSRREMKKLVLEDLNSADIERRKQALQLVGHLAPFEEAPELLCEALGDENRCIRLLAVQGLASKVTGLNVEQLIDAFVNEKDPEIRSAVASLLGRSDAERSRALDAFLERVCDENFDIESRANAARGLTSVGGHDAVAHVSKAVMVSEPRVRANAIEGLSQFPSDEAKSLLSSLLEDSSPRVCANAAIELWRLGAETVTKHLFSMLESDDPRRQACAAFALGEIGSDEVVGPLTEVYQSLSSRIVKTDEQLYVCENLARALEKIRIGRSAA